MRARRLHPRGCLPAALALVLALPACGGSAVPPDPVGSAPLATPAPGPAVAASVVPPPAASKREPSTARAPGAPVPSAQNVLGPVLAGGAPRTPRDPVTLAAHITVAEDLARDPASPPELVLAAGWVAQVAYRALGYRPGWDAAGLDAVADRYRDDVRRHTDARREFQDLAGNDLPDTLPAWQIVEPLPAAQLKALYLVAAERFAVPWEALAAINLVETGMGRIIGFSSAGANGPMQFIPQTWAAFGLGGDIRDPHDAIMGAANYLRARGGADGTERGLRRALFAYNNDLRYVRAVRAYMAILQDDPNAYPGLHAWRIYYRTPAGDVLLPIGYSSRRSIPVDQYLAETAGR